MNLPFSRAFSLSLAAVGLLASTGCGGSTASGGNGATTDSGTAGDAPVGEGGETLDGGEEANPGLVAVPLAVSCPPNLIYTADTTIGAQKFQLLVDTGSGTLGVASSTCTTCDEKPEYTPGPTAVDEKQTTGAQYGTGSWTGEVYQDTVTLGSASTPMKIAAIDTQTGFFQGQCYEGVLGFSPPAAVATGTDVFFEQLVATDKQIADVFSIKLCDSSGTLWLGGYDPSSTTAAPQYVPMTTGIVSTAYLAATLTSITASGTTVPIAGGQFPDSVLDTGTNAILLDTTPYNALTAAIQGDAAFTKVFGTTFFTGQTVEGLHCGTTSETKAALDAALPSLTLNFGSVAIQALPTESYLEDEGNGQWCSSLITDPSLSSEAPFSALLGSPILRSNIIIFDKAKSRIGFAPHTACP